MSLYKWEGEQFRKLQQSSFDQERDFEDLLARDPTILLNNEELLIISRQSRTTRQPKYDLLALDSRGNCVVIELKKGKLPRKAIAQILEYAASVSRLSYTALDNLAREWFVSNGREYTSLLDIHSRLFEYEIGAIREAQFNRRQRLILISEGADKKALEVVEYLMSLGVDITYISYLSYGAQDEILITTETILGHNVISEKKRTVYTTGRRLTRDIFRDTLSKNDELRPVAEQFLQYLDDCGASIRNRVNWLRVTIGGKWWIDTYPSKRATHFRVNAHGDFTPEQIAECHANLPAVTLRKFGVSFNIMSQDNLKYAIELFEHTRNIILED
ncbi:TPA: hypothetical protein EYP66_09445 [Candidatus Poribacteria bacterium]|nr:hypothetical protein [Candidatus Poribacteria bacterium]